ncbi:NAD(P)-dependent oxidoreductase [Paenibacillus arenosi]|uniref:NAD(P)-dependent oxidoreductase n=1 Tax=Paenibacillus arenosi TaxID=2774142 RepID=UPI001CDB8AAD|nr:SDR family oxidoreductase [Paenibacillus arenosi]
MKQDISTIAIIGGTGKVGRAIVKQALSEGYSVRMLARNPERVSVTHERLDVVQGDAQDAHIYAKLLEGSHAVINSFGQPGRDKDPIYSKVTNHIIAAMNELGIRRFIGITGGSLDVPGDQKSFVNRVGAKLFRLFFRRLIEDKTKELHILQHSEVDWTLLRIPFVVEGKAVGTLQVNEQNMPGTKMDSVDIAKFIMQQINDAHFIRKSPFISN